MDCARQLVAAFASYNAEFRAITRRAPLRFDSRDWKGSQRDAVERIELYDRFVNRTVAELRAALGAAAQDRELWRQIRAEFAARITDLPDPEFTKTFFSSVTRRLFGTVGVAPDIEFVATDLDPLAAVRAGVGLNTYVNHGSLPLLFEDLLGDVRFRSPWRDLDKSIAHVAAEVRAYLDSREERPWSRRSRSSVRCSIRYRGPTSSAASWERGCWRRWSSPSRTPTAACWSMR